MWLWACDLVGMSEMMELMYDEPEFVDELFDKIMEHQIAVCKNAIRIGADIIDETDDYGFNNGPLVSPAMFKEFCAPRIKKFADAIHEAGGKVIKHSDGDIKLLFDDIVATGVDAHHSMDPEAGVDIAYMKKTYGDKLCLIGNIDCGNLLAFGTPEDVREAVRKCIEIAGPGGGYIVASSNSLPATAKPENVKMIVDAAREFGKYPLHV